MPQSESKIRSSLELGPQARRIFAAVYVTALAAVIIAAQRNPDHVFGFQMFNESSRMRIELFRRVRGAPSDELVKVVDGSWQARDRRGKLRSFSYHDRIRDRTLGRLDQSIHAPYGLDAQLFRLKLALEDVLSHTRDDKETQALVAVVDTVKNGRPGPRVRVTAVRR
jgi:hypothetical protein